MSCVWALWLLCGLEGLGSDYFEGVRRCSPNILMGGVEVLQEHRHSWECAGLQPPEFPCDLPPVEVCIRHSVGQEIEQGRQSGLADCTQSVTSRNGGRVIGAVGEPSKGGNCRACLLAEGGKPAKGFLLMPEFRVDGINVKRPEPGGESQLERGGLGVKPFQQ